jgi:hypothetical protein
MKKGPDEPKVKEVLRETEETKETPLNQDSTEQTKEPEEKTPEAISPSLSASSTPTPTQSTQGESSTPPIAEINMPVIEVRDATPISASELKETPLQKVSAEQAEELDVPKETKETEEPEDTKKEEVSDEPKEKEIEETKETKIPESPEEPAETKISSWDLEEEASPLDKENKSFFKLGIIVLAIILVVTGIFLFFFLSSNSKKTPVEAKKITTTTITPKKAQINKSEWTLEVLNGSGVPGAAAKAAAKLTEQGYEVVKTGNADNQDYTKSELFIAENMQSKAQLLIDDLSSDYTFSSTPEVLKNSTVSARIIIGKD